jgi:serine/threonine protein kinase
MPSQLLELPATQICDDMERLQFLTSAEMNAIRERWFRPDRQEIDNPDKFCQWLVLNGYVSDFVARAFLSGKIELLVFNGYKLRDRIAGGPMNGSYLATDSLGRWVALDILAPAQASDASVLQAFQKAARQAMRVHHVNVQRILDTGAAHQLHYLVKENIEGETLRTLLQRRTRIKSSAQAERLFILILAGLEALHAEGVPAGDLSAEQIVLTGGKGSKDRTAKILNPGLKRSLFDHSALDVFHGGSDDGTVDSIIPDTLNLASSVFIEPIDQGTVQPKEEIFQLGCLFYEMVTGKPPYAPQDLPRPVHAAVPVRERAPEVSELLADVIDGMIDPDPAKRPAKVAHVEKALRVYQAAEEDAVAAPADDETVKWSPERANGASAAANGEAEDTTEADLVSSASIKRVKVKKSAPAEDDRTEEYQPANKLEELWNEVKPQARDYFFLGLGAFAFVFLVFLFKLLTGIEFVNIVCLLAGFALTYFVDRLVRWRERPSDPA